MRISLIKIIILLIIAYISTQSLQAMDSLIKDEKRNLCLSIEIGLKLIKFYEDELIYYRFSDEDLKRIENSECVGENNSKIKPIYVKIPFWVYNAKIFYEENYVKPQLITYNINNYNLHTSISTNAYGFLSIPDGQGPFPCVILCHGSEGGGYMAEQMNSLASQSIATLFMNRFSHHVYEDESGTCRYVITTALNQQIISLEGEIIETLFAAKLIASHPKVDQKKIGFMGWSRGGNVALECSMKRNIDLIYPGFKPAFCINYYSMPLIERKDVPAAPILFLHGANDEYTPVRCLISYVNFLLSQNYILPQPIDNKVIFESNTVRIVIYPKAGHAFDVKTPSFPTIFKETDNLLSAIQCKWNEIWEGSFQVTNSTYMNMSECCVRALDDDTGFMDSDDKIYQWSQFPTYVTKKIKFGVKLEVNHKAGIDAWQEALAFIHKHTKSHS